MNTLDDPGALAAVRALRDVLGDIRNMTTAIAAGQAPSAPELTRALDSLARRIEGAGFAYACAAASQAADDAGQYAAGFIAGKAARGRMPRPGCTGRPTHLHLAK